MLKKIIKQLEGAKKYQIPHIEAGIEMAISIIKKHEKEFEDAIKKAYKDGETNCLQENLGNGGEYKSPQDYCNQNYKNEQYRTRKPTDKK